ncbi:MAG: hypothetical protein WD468_11655, partial [Pirellulales bacterium]
GHLEEDSAWNGVLADQNSDAGTTIHFTKVGGGSLTLGTGATPSTNLYKGVTTVKNGTLVVNGTHATGSSYLIEKGGTLGGTGIITTTSITFSDSVGAGTNSTLSPGASIGTLTLNAATNVVLNPASKLVMDLDGGDTSIGGTTNDLVVIGGIGGNLTLDGTLDVNAVASFASATAGDTWRLMTYTGTLTDNGLVLGSIPTLASGLFFALDTLTSGQVNLTINAIPEANAFLFGGVACCVVGLACVGRKLQSRNVSSQRA